MLHSVQIRNFYTCEDVTLDRLGQLTALAGKNGVGKTSIMRLIHMAARNIALSTPYVTANLFLEVFAAAVVKPSKSMEIEFTAAGRRLKLVQGWRIESADAGQQPPNLEDVARGKVRMTLSETLLASNYPNDEGWTTLFGRRDDEIRIPGRNEGIKVSPAASGVSSLRALLPKDDPLLPTLTATLNFFRSFHYYSLDEPNILSDAEGSSPFVRANAYQQWVVEGDKATAPPAQFVLMRLVHISETAREKLDELKQLVGPEGLGLLKDIEVQKFTIPSSTTSQASANDVYHFVRFALPGDEASRTYTQLSFGTRRILRLLLSILTDESTVALLEQPEDGIHQGLLHKVIALLHEYAQPGQIILSTHSPAVFNGLRPEEVRLVYLKGGRTKLRSLTEEEIATAELYLSTEGEFAEFLRSVEE